MKKQGLYLPEFEHENCGAGFICNLNGKKTNQIIHDALEILVKLEHRGGVSSDGKTGDGAGLLIDIPHDYFTRVCDFSLPKQRDYAVGMVFLPKNTNQYQFCKDVFEKEIKNQGLSILGWRKVPVDSSVLGKIALASEPNIEQLFITKTEDISEATFKAKLYAARKITEHEIRNSKISESNYFYVPSLSTTTIIYKGIIMPEDIENTVLVPHKGDISGTDVTLTNIGGFELPVPVTSRGGARYPNSPLTPEGNYWASMKTGAVPFQNKAEGLMESLKMDATGVYTAMGREANYFNQAFADGMLQWAQSMKLPKEAIKKFDDDLRKSKPDWVGLNSPEARDQLLGVGNFMPEGAGKFRGAFTKTMSKSAYRDLGFPTIVDIEKAFIDR